MLAAGSVALVALLATRAAARAQGEGEPTAPTATPAVTPNSAKTQSTAKTWTVDDDGPASFRDLPAAIEAAMDGDTLLLRPGHYSAAELDQKGLQIIGAGAGATTIESRSGSGPFFSATSLSAKQQLVLSGVMGIGHGSSLEVTRCAGIVVVADVVVDCSAGARGPRFDQCGQAFLTRVAVIPPTTGASPGDFGLSIAQGGYALTQVVAIGGPGAPGISPRGRGGNGSVGLAISDARADVALCDFLGGKGGAALWDEFGPFCPEAATGGNGGSGLFIAGAGRVHVLGDRHQSFGGGDGGDATQNPWERCWSFPGDGGSGIFLHPEVAAGQVLVSGVVAAGGVAGPAGGGRAARAGRGIESAPDIVTEIAEPWPTLALEPGAVLGGRAKVHVFGTAGDNARLLVSGTIRAARVKESKKKTKTDKKGVTLQVGPGNTWLELPIGRIDESGQVTLEVDLPTERSFIGRPFVIQAQVATPKQSGRSTKFTNVDLLVIADGTPAAGAGSGE